MEFFLDSANLDDIRACTESGIISGVTVNQSLLAKEPKRPYIDHLRDIVELIRPGKLHLSAPVPHGTASAMIEAGKSLRNELRYENLSLKVPVAWQYLPVIRALSQGGAVNATCVFTSLQAKIAINAGAKAVSVFVGRINDADTRKEHGYVVLRQVSNWREDAAPVPAATTKLFGSEPKPSTLSMVKTIAGSIRDKEMVDEAVACWPDIITTSRIVLESLATDEHAQVSIDKFDSDWNTWTA